MPVKKVTVNSKKFQQKFTIVNSKKTNVKRKKSSPSIGDFFKDVFQDSFKSFVLGIGLLLLFFTLISVYLSNPMHLAIHPLATNVHKTSKSNHLSNIIAVPPNQAINSAKQHKLPSTAQQYTYIIATNDTLWSIAEKSYGSGFNWKVIAKVNNITDPENLTKGQKIIIPTINSNEQVASSENVHLQKPLVTMYKIQVGDSLWTIAERNYHSGYAWTLISQANALTNPSIIFAGNTLKLPPPPVDKTLGFQ